MTANTDMMQLTIFFRHNQALTLDEILAQLKKTGFWKHFPPDGMEIVSWQVLMGIGHVVTLRLPPDRLRELNITVERYAWGAFTTEFYPSYDFSAVYPEYHRKALAGEM
jgi:hypothetical protein